MSELHTEESAPEVIDQVADTGTVENGPELATGGDENPDTINQDAVQQKLNRSHHLVKKSERATAAETVRADALQARLDEIDDKNAAPTISILPDQYDVSEEEYAKAVAKRDDEVRASAIYSNGEAARQDAALKKQNDAAASRQRKQQESVTSYVNRAAELKVTDQQLKEAATVIGDFGMQVDVVNYILDDPNGPLITTYLAKNTGVLDELTRMNPMQAAVMISQKISPKFASTKPLNSSSPDPLNRIKGSGAAPRKRGATGTTFS